MRDEVAFYTQFLGPGDLCFDVGANYGMKAEAFLRLGARVIAFEPQAECIREMRARLGPHPNLVLVHAAVGSHTGRATLNVGRHRTNSSLVEDWQGEVVGSVEVPITTLDEAIARYGKPRHCKIDVEGFELEVLKGLSQAIPTLSFENHLWRDGAVRAVECLDRLSQLGEISVNVTPAETPAFAGLRWQDRDEFVEFFRQEISNAEGRGYGDIFVNFKVEGPDVAGPEAG